MSALGYPFVPYAKRDGLEPPRQCPCGPKCRPGAECGIGNAAHAEFLFARHKLACEWAKCAEDLERALLADLPPETRGTVAMVLARRCARDVDDRHAIAALIEDEAAPSVLRYHQLVPARAEAA